MSAEQNPGITALADWMAGREVGDRHKSLFWAGCRAAEQGLEPGPLIAAAVTAGLGESESQRAVAGAAATIAAGRKDHGKISS